MDERKRQTAGWQLEQSGPEAYERYLVPPMFAPWAERLIDRIDLRTGDRVLDVGCGTGIVARRVAARMGDEGSVVGLDTNEGMLDVAEATAAESRLAIEWRQGDASEIPFPDGAFDVVCCQQTLQFVPDPGTVVREIRRVLAPGGRAAVTVWRPLEFNPGYVTLAEALEHYVADDAGMMMRSPFPSWDGDYLRVLARAAGFSKPSVFVEIGSVRYPSATEFVRREAASSPLSESLGDLAQEVREALVTEVEDALREYTDDDGLVFPMESYVLIVHREAY